MSKSPYLSNPNILAHPDRIVQKVELDMTAQDSYLAGSPISAEGKLANDASAIGILLYDVHKAIGGRTGVVVIFGRIKQDVAAEHSGITISAEAKAALIDITFTGDGCRMGGGGLTELPEGYPYKEMGKTEFAILGEVEFGEFIDTIAQANAFVNEEIVVGETYAVVLDGKEYVATAYERTGSTGMTLKMIGNAAQDDGTFDENGPPFNCTTLKYGEQVALIMNIKAEVGTHTVEIYKFAETIQPMAEEFMPLLTSPNGTKYKLTVADDGTLSAVAQS